MWGWALLAGGGLWLLTRKKGAPGQGARQGESTAGTLLTSGSKSWDGKSSQATYIRKLFNHQMNYIPIAKSLYNIDRLRRITLAASKYFGVPPEWVWGTMWGESRWTPIGLYGIYSGTKNPSPDKAIAASSSAFGLSQMLGGRFRKSETPFLRKHWGNNPWVHMDLVDPKIAIWTQAGTYGRGLASRGGGPGATKDAQAAAIRKMKAGKGGLLLGHWMAGFIGERAKRGAEKKMRHIATYGPDVWSKGKPAKGSTAWTSKPGPTYAEDDLPPWGGKSTLNLTAHSDTAAESQPSVSDKAKEDAAVALALAELNLAIGDALFAAGMAEKKAETAETELAIGEGQIVGFQGLGDHGPPGAPSYYASHPCGVPSGCPPRLDGFGAFYEGDDDDQEED